MACWIDGRPDEPLPPTDRGLAYGDGLFETIAVRRGQPLLLERHLARLGEGCARLALPGDPASIRAELLAFSAALGEGVAKLLLTRGDGLRGYAAPQPPQSRRILLGSPPPRYPPGNAAQGVRLYPCRTRLAEQPLLAGLKHLNRLEQVLARAEWRDAEHAEGLMRDLSGRVIEGVFSNLFLVRDGVLLTADLCRCGVAGVMRAEILEQAERAGIALQVRDIDFAELLAADEVFLCNSLYGIWPVRRFEEHDWPVGTLTRKLQGSIRKLLDS
ncbi:4-amino-4-deoxychorismate lyase [Azotobacter vinelandii CA]|uniref:Aminodeoxychorismate lyase n=2 Tax=Azotobacter vinelandii TaxID=354 RepID=C1DRH2_AZOVD|nr:aminodeoxychorismate lyase [Azotobacter vinelandii]ACO77710.1 4-amino-4-deoxychorismate lyase [Azotobacter vinelandii DJ]AGK12617.1 4-amino-4-deoxychorismate lyase [Azotobacter vinelandii CA]AGK18446.1 4-amino-4-deoxychorismate lyase [Azotobacter vinelandii CA6]WKN23471.1 aminodeoxychorismate lyase [Azotobacter vinelandii]SFX83466.1 aminodeoxychorismate lyase apoprotein [Azotobacter vinelandii]